MRISEEKPIVKIKIIESVESPKIIINQDETQSQKIKKIIQNT